MVPNFDAHRDELLLALALSGHRPIRMAGRYWIGEGGQDASVQRNESEIEVVALGDGGFESVRWSVPVRSDDLIDLLGHVCDLCEHLAGFRHGPRRAPSGWTEQRLLAALSGEGQRGTLSVLRARQIAFRCWRDAHPNSTDFETSAELRLAVEYCSTIGSGNWSKKPFIVICNHELTSLTPCFRCSATSSAGRSTSRENEIDCGAAAGLTHDEINAFTSAPLLQRRIADRNSPSGGT